MPKEVCDLVESLLCSRILGEDPMKKRSPCWSTFAGRTCDPTGDPFWRSLLLKYYTPWKRPMLEQSVPEGLYLAEGTYVGTVH